MFTRSGTTWSQDAYIKASNTDAQDEFSAVTLAGDGKTLAVGARGEASNATGIDGVQTNNAGPSTGAVYVFTRSGATWSQQAYVKASNSGGGDQFGFTVKLSDDGNTLAVSAPMEDSNATGVGGNEADNSMANAGAVYVFTRAGATWSQEAYIKASNADVGDNFGEGLALSADGNTLAAGAPYEKSKASGINGDQADNSAAVAGAAYVFARAGSWSQQAYVKASNQAADYYFGAPVTLSSDGTTLAVGSRNESNAATGINGSQTGGASSHSGAVYTFTGSGGVWSQLNYVKAPNSHADDNFGTACGLSSDGSELAVGAWHQSGGSAGINGDLMDVSQPQAGAAYVYQ